MEQNYTLLRGFSQLTPSEREFVYKESELQKEVDPAKLKRFEEYYSIFAIRNEKLVAFVSYRKQGRDCLINKVYGLPKKDFVTKYRTTPAGYLLEELIRRKARIFIANGFTKKGELLFSKRVQHGLIKSHQIESLGLGFKVTKLGQKQALGRNPRVGRLK